MDYNYSEIICTAIDEIVTAKLQGLEYDITKQCTIVDDSQSHKGKYVVSDGTSKYEAYSTDVSFKKGNSVLVTIPNGNYDLQKTIVCRISADDTTPFNYTSPMDTMIKITNNIFDDAKVVYGENIGLLANDSNQSTAAGPIYSLTESAGFAGFTRLGITANFKSLLNGLDVASGAYGLKLLIYTETSTSPGVRDNAVYELSFNSSDMIGNPYQFESYFYQEKVFDISSINNIKRIDVYFYQNGQFYDGNNNYIEWQYIDTLLGPTKLQNNLFVDDVKIYLGYDMGAFSEETLLLYTNDALTYHYTNDPLYKTVALRWIHKLDDNTYQLLNKSDLQDEFEVHWFRYKKGYEVINQYAGNDWEELLAIDENPFGCDFVPDIAARSEQIKVIGLQKTITGTDDNGENIFSITPYYSNLMIFENEENVPDKITYDAATALSIVCEDGSEGNYYLYNQNGKIENEGNGQGNKRYLKAMFQGAEIDSNLGLGESDYIKWYFPVENTMLTFSSNYFTENEGVKSDEIKSYYGVDYYEIARGTTNVTISGKPELTSTKQAYSIGNQWNYKNSNNTIRCAVRIKGVEYEAIEELRFGKAGTNGTNTTFLIEFVNNANALIVGKNNTVTVRARLYDSNGSNVGFHQSQANTIQWSWHKQTPNKNYISFPSGVQSDVITLTCNTETLPQDNYYILKATYGMLEAYLPIPLKTSNTSHIEGAREIIYNNQGNPSYYSDAYVLYTYNQDGYTESEASWVIRSNEETQGMSLNYIPSLQDIPSRRGYKGLSASPFYASGYNDMVCVSGSGNQCGWSQPILIMQSRYDFAMLNQWDGTLTIDENNGTIMSTMLGAGRKNISDDPSINNTFSGVLIGDIRGGSGNANDTDVLTGVYGLHQGVTSFALKEDGTATFGKKGHGQILIDGNTSTIQSADYSLTSLKGTRLDLDDGILDIKFNLGRILLQPEDPYLFIRSVNNNTLLQIGTKENFLQSDNFQATSGTLLDLSKGNLDIRSEKTQIYISGDEGESAKEKPYFKISIPENTNDKVYANSLFLIDKQDYYLKSANYKESTYITINNYNTYQQPKNPIVNISDIVAISPSGTVYKTDGVNILSAYEFPAIEGKNVGTEEHPIYVSQTSTQVKQTYIADLIPNLEATTATKGFKLDLNNSIINGYDLYLKGTNTSLNKSFLLDSGAPEIPFQIGSKFKVSWNGTLTCNDVNSLNNDGRDNYAISINNNFYVTKGGGAGGSSANFGYGNFGSGWFGGTSSVANIAKRVETSMVGPDMAGQSGWGFAFVNGSGYIRQTSMNALTFVKQTDYDTKITELETAISNLSSTLSTVSSNLNAHRHYYYDYKNIITGDVKRTSSDRYGNF